jgi:hypothetical protein
VQNKNVELDLEKEVGLAFNIGGLKVENVGPVLWRSGATLSHRSRMALLPKHDIAVVVLSNDTRSWKAIENITEQTLQLMAQVKVGIKQNKNKTEGSENNEKYVGGDKHQPFLDYYTSFLGYIPVHKNAGEITANLLGWPFGVKTSSEGWYRLEYDLFGLIPIDVSWMADLKIRPAKVNGKNILIALFKGKKYLVAVHSAFNKIDRAWNDRLGEYRVINHDALLETLEVERGTLMMQEGKLFFVYELPNWYGFELSVPVNTISPDLAIIPGLGTALNETIQVRRYGNTIYLEYSGYLLEKVKEETSVSDYFSF